MAKTVTCNKAIWRHIELLQAEAELVIPPGRTPFENCDWNTTGSNSGLVESELREHASRSHGLDIDSLKPDVRQRVLAAIADA